MTPNQKSSPQSTDADVKLFEFSVVLVANEHNPTIINRDFLLNNGIVVEQRPLDEPPPFSTPATSQVAFDSGLTVRGDRKRVVFEQSGEPLSIEDVLCAEIAKRYLKTIPHVNYTAIGVNPKGYRVLAGRPSDGVAGALIDNGTWMKHRSAVPSFGLKATYQYDAKKITLDIFEGEVIEADQEKVRILALQGNIHRDIQEENQQMRLSSLLSILDSWRDDYSEYVVITEKFCRPGATK